MTISNKASNTTKTMLLSILVLTSAYILTSAAVHRVGGDDGTGTITATPATFNNYELAGNPFISGYRVGTTCPNTNRTCAATEAEPQIRADPAGNFYGSSENVFCVIGGLCGGTFAYKSTDGGQHFTTLPLPNSASAGQPGVSPAGGDTDIAVAPRRNANGFFNVYVASLAHTLTNVFVSTSKDGGNSWFINPTGATVTSDDREWIAADGANKVCVSNRAPVPATTIFVQCSFDAGTTFLQPASAFDSNHLFLATGTRIGNLAIDPGNHLIYQTFSGVANAGELLSAGPHVVYVAVSIDGGLTFTDHVVYNNPNINTRYGHQFVNISVDSAGNVYSVFSDNHNLFYSFSRTFGQTWSGPFQINQSPSNTAIMPWSAAGTAGSLDVVWYGTDFFDGINPPDNYPSSAGWKVYFSQNLNALTPGSSWTQVPASATIHFGGVCEGGVTCAADNTQNRDLLDDFGIATSPTTGLAAIIYTDDQFLNSTAEPATRRTSGSYVCTQSLSNTVDCSHTDIAIQTGGSTTNQNHHEFEVDDEDFEEMDLSNDGNHSPSFEMKGTDTGTAAISSISAQIGGLPLILTWSNSFPVQPGHTASATTKSTPLGLVLAVGNIYPVTITTTMADGTIETQTTYAIYTLGAGIGL